MKIGVRPAARRDIILQVGYYLEQRAYDAAERFPPAVQEAFARIQEQPGIGAPCNFDHPDLADLRSWPIPGFEEIRVYYVLAAPDLIRVVRVLHGKRDLARVLGDAAK
jgi:plasmid stabilization system protein ParE